MSVGSSIANIREVKQLKQYAPHHEQAKRATVVCCTTFKIKCICITTAALGFTLVADVGILNGIKSPPMRIDDKDG